MTGELAPAVGGDLAVFGIQPNDDVAAKRGAGVLQKAGVFNRCGADDDVAQASIEVAFNGVKVANATTELHIDFAANFSQDFADRDFVFGLAGKRAIQIDQVQTSSTLVNPIPRHGCGVFAEDGGLIHVALFEANAVAIFQVNRGDK